MKKKIIFSAIAITIIVIMILPMINMLSKGIIFGKLYRVDNVYEEIWNLVQSEKNRNQTILTTSKRGTDVIFDKGHFAQINVPINDEYTATLGLHNINELRICLHVEHKTAAIYIYNYESNTLFGNREEEFLIENFLSSYYSLIGNDGKFSLDNHGNYTFIFEEYPYSHH